MHYPILIRIDDVCPTMDEAKFDQCISFLNKFGYKPLLGVIPDCKDENLNYGCVNNFWDKVKKMQQEGYPIAMHGLHHTYTQKQKGLVCSRPMSEFTGLPYEIQYKMLVQGKKIMQSHDLDTSVFFAPGHSYDRNTLKALNKAGLSVNSDGKSLWPYELEGVFNIPVNGPFRIHFGRGVLTIALHPSADAEKTYVQLERYLKRNRNRLLLWDGALNMKRRFYGWCRVEEKANMVINSAIEKMADVRHR